MKSKSKLIAASVLFTTVAGSALLASTGLSLAGLNDSSCWEQRQVTARDPIHARGCGSLGAVEPNNGERVKPAGVTLGKKLGGTRQNNPPPSPTPAASPPASPPPQASPPASPPPEQSPPTTPSPPVSPPPASSPPVGPPPPPPPEVSPPPPPPPEVSPPPPPPPEVSPPPPPKHEDEDEDDHEHKHKRERDRERGNNGHGNEPDGYDNSNPGRKSGRDGSDHDGRPGSGHNNH